MASIRLCSEEVKLMVKHRELGRTNQQIAEMMGVTEGAVRYRVNKSRNPVPDRRRNRPSRVSNWRRVIERWFDGTSGSRRRPSMKVLYDHLCKNHGFGLSYSALRRWIRKTYPDWWKMKVRIRLETPPGQLVQVDWKENILVRIADQVVRINVFIFELCFSRKSILLVSQRRDLPSFISAHQAAFRRLGGLPGFIRPDCMKTAVNKWRGFKSDLNKQYERYLNRLGVQVIPARPRTPTDKGKVEKRIRDVFDRIDIHNHIFDSLQQVQQYLDRTVADLEHEWLSGATGCSVYDSFSFERKALKSLPAHFPPLPVKEQRKTVYKDGLVYFDGNYYQLPAQYRKQKVLCVHTGQKILIYHGNELIADFAVLAGSKNMVRLNPQAIEDDNVHLSKPVRQWAMEVALRQVEWYEQLVQQRDGHGY